MPAYWKKIFDSVEQPGADLSLAVLSPPVVCWICGEGFVAQWRVVCTLLRSPWRLRGVLQNIVLENT